MNQRSVRPRVWPWVIKAVVLAAATGIAAGNTAEAVLGAYLMRRLAGEHGVAFDHLVAVRALVLVAGPLSALASAGIGVGTLWLTGALPPHSQVASAMGLWWGGDYLGALVVAPVLLSWATHTDGFVGRRPAVELALFAGGALLVAELVLGRLFPVSFLPQIEYPYLLF